MFLWLDLSSSLHSFSSPLEAALVVMIFPTTSVCLFVLGVSSTYAAKRMMNLLPCVAAKCFFLIIFRVWTRFVPYTSLFLNPLFPLNLFMLFWFAVSKKAIIFMIVLEVKSNLMILQGLDMEPIIEI